jgi:hypothetical protein
MTRGRVLVIFVVAFFAATVPAFAAPPDSLCEQLLLGVPTARNPFFALEGQMATLAERQAAALEILVADAELPAALREQAGHKRDYFRHESTPQRLREALGRLDPAARRLAALELAVTTFRSASWDGSFLGAVLSRLSLEAFADGDTVALLAELTRGVQLPDLACSRLANEAIRAISLRTGRSHPARGPPADGLARTEPADILLHEPIARVEPLGGGKNTTLLVTFVNGVRGVFKPMTGELGYGDRARSTDWILFPREVSAYDLVERGLFEGGERRAFVPVTVETVLVHDGVTYGVGSLQFFEEGFVSLSKLIAEKPADWERLRATREWHEAEAFARTVDFMLGNYDRFPNTKHRNGNLSNVMVKLEADGSFRMALIDNGIGRNVDPGRWDFGLDNCPLREHIPAELKRAILEFDESAVRRRYATSLPADGLEEFFARVRAVRERILHGP